MPSGFGGLPAPSFQPLLKGRNQDALPLSCGTHAHLVVVNGEMHHAAAELEELFARVAVAAVLLDGVLDGLLGQAVLELKSGNGQAVDEQAQIQRPTRLRRGCRPVAASSRTGSAHAGRRRGVAFGRGAERTA